MKVQDFVMKYGIPQSIVYSASFNTPTRKAYRLTDIPEDELMKAVKLELYGRIKYHQAKIEKAKEHMSKLGVRL